MHDLEKAQVILKLARKNNWDNKYDRLEHFKRFQYIAKIVKELSSKGWILIRKKPNFIAISLNPKYKKDIIEYVETKMPYVKGMIR